MQISGTKLGGGANWDETSREDVRVFACISNSVIYLATPPSVLKASVMWWRATRVSGSTRGAVSGSTRKTLMTKRHLMTSSKIPTFSVSPSAEQGEDRSRRAAGASALPTQPHELR